MHNGAVVEAAHIDVERFLRERSVVPGDEPLRFEALPGGVSSDIWLVEAGGERVCVKRALPKLKVAADWRAPVERNAYEVAWMEVARSIVSESVPRVLAHDPERGMFAMTYLEPAFHPAPGLAGPPGLP